MSSLYTRPLRALSRAVARDDALRCPWICSSCQQVQTRRNILNSKTGPIQSWSRRSSRYASTLSSSQSEGKVVDAVTPPNNETQLSLQSLRKLLRHNVPDPKASQRSQQQHDPYGLSLALKSKNPNEVWTSILQATNDPEYVSKIPRTTWTEILLVLDPQKLLPMHRIQRSFNNEQLKSLGYDHKEKAWAWADTFIQLFLIRRQSSSKPELSDYRIALQHAASIGNMRVASMFWSDMKRDGIMPDRLCYNAYLEANVWQETRRLKQAARARSALRYEGSNPLDITLFKPGCGAIAIETLDEMSSKGVDPDIATYCAVITALARDGQLTKCWPILSEQWGIDTDSMMQGKLPMQLPLVKQPQSSATYPNERLLVTLVDAFGSNNKILPALHLLVFFSRHYGLKMNERVSYQLAKWTWLQARVKPQERTNESSYTPSFESVRQVADYITENLKLDPSMDQLHIFFKSAGISVTHTDFDVDNPRGFDKHLSLIENGRQQYHRRLEAYQKASHALAQAEAEASELAVLAPSMHIQTQRDTCQRLKLRKQMAHQLLLRWCRELVAFRTTFDMADWQIESWRVRGLPEFLRFYGAFCPTLVKYKVAGGLVELEFRSPEQVQRDRARKQLADGVKSYHALKKLDTVNRPSKSPHRGVTATRI